MKWMFWLKRDCIHGFFIFRAVEVIYTSRHVCFNFYNDRCFENCYFYHFTNINLIYSYLKSPSFSSYLYYLALNNPNKLHITISLIFASMKVKIYKLLETKLRYQVI